MHLASGRADGVDADSAYGLAYQAALKALIAVLLATGRRVTSGAGGHVVIIREAARSLPGNEALFTRLDAMRRTRHTLFYDLEEVTDSELTGALADTEEVIELASIFVREHT